MPLLSGRSFSSASRPSFASSLSHSHPLSSRSSTARRVVSSIAIATSVRDASDFVDLCRLYGYEAEEHVTQTKDGFLLGLHRLAWKKGEEGKKVNNGPNTAPFPFVLRRAGAKMFWLGNTRGNKYSKKSVKHSPTSLEFGNFSIEEFAFHDIPDSISARGQAFATLAIHPKLNGQVKRVLSRWRPPCRLPACRTVSWTHWSRRPPQVLFLLFGRRSILSSATMWQSILYPPIFVKLIDYGLTFLFNWRTKNITVSQKLAAYPHLYSFTSTKSVVHWFQIIRNKSFQMYDDDVQQHMSLNTSSKYTKVAKYPTRNIKTPIVLVYGGSDSLVDIKVMLRELPPQTVATEIPHYEHLDFLWGRDVDHQVFPHVFDALDNFTDPQHSAEEFAKYQMAREESLIESGAAYHGHASRASDASTSDLSTLVVENGQNGTRPVTPTTPVQQRSRGRPSGIPSPQNTTRARTAYQHQHQAVEHRPASSDDGADSRPSTADQQTLDGAQEVKESPATKLKGIGVRRGSGGSALSFEGGRGINIGTGKAPGVSGLVTTGGIDTKGVINASPVSEARRKKKKT
ncbi:sterol esterase TGL1 [Verticillium alfalfae VaMs.102]|uniref:Sterol esterase TGL1 n=1 Tax=Verticillium alfalfae (strain VaMs.102 / ATCC MYA-4576 / FGSC 10136) TaxID=526221 RepID=C9SAX2_VERA1|nr:sterol esterase TGL1 [Verticillium alfalfae VaMs.102]EEY15546.1 sterol esterase TGL1 [Verticillium alfalfae VaMs.102]